MTLSKKPLALAASLALGLLALQPGAAFAQKGETVKIAWIDPLSGLMAPIGQNQLKSFQYLAELFNKNNPAGVKFEIVPFDNKVSPAESLNNLKSALDQNIRYVTQGDGSGAAGALVDAINKNNERNPGKEVLYMNYAAVDPDLTNGKCSYWHFRLDADTSMKMEALTTFIKDQKDIHKVYLIGQNYAHGVQVAKYARADLARKRPDIEIVGEDLHPLAKVTDFAPYVAKIRASGADSVITGNWGSDLSLLVKAANEAGLNVKFFTYYANNSGSPTSLGPSAAGRVYFVGYGHSNMGGPIRKIQDDFKAKFNDDFYVGDIYTELQLLSEAMAKAKSTDPVKVAAALEGLRLKSYNGDIEMRKSDHQLQQDLWISVWQKTDAKNPYSVENTGYTFAPVAHYDSYVASTPTSCQMKRPDPVVDQVVVNLLNGVSSGLLLFMLSSGLTLIFSMMGVLNFAHAGFYMLGAYVGYATSRVVGFWPALVAAPLVVGALGALFERVCLRRVHRFGHVPELLITFGLSYLILEVVQVVWGRAPVAFDPPALLAQPAFTLVQSAGSGLAVVFGRADAATCAHAACTTFPATRAFMMGVALLMLLALWLLLRHTRVGLVIQAALTHPEMAEALGHNVPRVFMLVFGAGCALAGLAGVVGGTTFVTEPSMAASVGSILFVVVVVGGTGSLKGAFVGSLLIGLLQTVPLTVDRSLADASSRLGWAVSPDSLAYPVMKLTLAQVTPVLPYLLLVLMLIVRPRGLFGTRDD